MRSIREIEETLRGNKVLMRVDFDVPVNSSGKIEEPFRILKQKEMLDFMLFQGAKVVITAHISACSSFRDILSQLEEILMRQLRIAVTVEELGSLLAGDEEGVVLLDNIRNFEGEKRNDDHFARQLASYFDLYVNNAFAVSHRHHASVSAITKFLRSYSGFLLEQEVMQLQKALLAPAAGKVIIMGGAKAATKIPVIKNFLSKSDVILTGGVIANDIMKARGVDIGRSCVDDNLHELLEGFDVSTDKILVPKDFNMANGKILDIGPETIRQYENIIRKSRMVIWNGPMGMFEDANFAKGTEAIARIVGGSNIVSIVGGGDTIAAINRFSSVEPFTFVSTGGGAMLEYLAGHTLPGIAALHGDGLQ